jgi:hypothetical protein
MAGAIAERGTKRKLRESASAHPTHTDGNRRAADSSPIFSNEYRAKSGNGPLTLRVNGAPETSDPIATFEGM